MSTDKFFNAITLLRCPICGAAFSTTGASLVCQNGHTFDPSRKGYVHFAPNVAPSRYDKELFEARRRILEAGFYDGVIEAIRAAMPKKPDVVLDAGCGDGTFTKRLQGKTTVGIDLSKDAIQLAARGGGPILWAVGDLTRLPIADASADVVLNLFSPAHYAEFTRVLKPDGTLLKLVPQQGYLKEIRALMGDRLRKEQYSNEAVVSHLSERFRIADRTRVTYTLPLTREQAGDLIRMTPLTFGAEPDMLDALSLSEITIDVEILIAKK
ncbi:MAG: methyltransferase domain-containing protein [Clostridia bacterium]|nr:methyltransferase domain-containing protein [Clostridia bacterium]